MPRAKLKAAKHHAHLFFSEEQPCVLALFKRGLHDKCTSQHCISSAILHTRISIKESQLKTLPVATWSCSRHSLKRCLAPLGHRILLTMDFFFQFYFTDYLIKNSEEKNMYCTKYNGIGQHTSRKFSLLFWEQSAQRGATYGRGPCKGRMNLAASACSHSPQARGCLPSKEGVVCKESC